MYCCEFLLCLLASLLLTFTFHSFFGTHDITAIMCNGLNTGLQSRKKKILFCNGSLLADHGPVLLANPNQLHMKVVVKV